MSKVPKPYATPANHDSTRLVAGAASPMPATFIVFIRVYSRFLLSLCPLYYSPGKSLNIARIFIPLFFAPLRLCVRFLGLWLRLRRLCVLGRRSLFSSGSHAELSGEVCSVVN